VGTVYLAAHNQHPVRYLDDDDSLIRRRDYTVAAEIGTAAQSDLVSRIDDPLVMRWLHSCVGPTLSRNAVSRAAATWRARPPSSGRRGQ
jgi:hypothetical protein